MLRAAGISLRRPGDRTTIGGLFGVEPESEPAAAGSNGAGSSGEEEDEDEDESWEAKAERATVAPVVIRPARGAMTPERKGRSELLGSQTVRDVDAQDVHAEGARSRRSIPAENVKELRAARVNI